MVLRSGIVIESLCDEILELVLFLTDGLATHHASVDSLFCFLYTCVKLLNIRMILLYERQQAGNLRKLFSFSTREAKLVFFHLVVQTLGQRSTIPWLHSLGGMNQCYNIHFFTAKFYPFLV